MSELSPQRHWNTWRSEYPAQMMHLPLKLTVTPTAYAAASRRFTDTEEVDPETDFDLSIRLGGFGQKTGGKGTVARRACMR